MENLSDISTIKEIMRRHNFNFSKSLGQNFLVNPSVCPKIAAMGGACKQNGIIEIGTGFGVLTVELAKLAKKVVAIEIDSKLMPVLDETLKDYNNINVINEDVLKVDLKELIEKEFVGMDICVCANLPYYITSPIIMSLLEQKLPIKSITVMVQKEAADRLCASPGTRQCGAVTLAVNYYSKPKLLFNVSRGSFMPSPNVDSAVIKLDIKDELPTNVLSEKHLFQLIRAAFSQRRKTLANPVCANMSIPKADILNALASLGLSQTARAEELKLEQFINLSNLLFSSKQ
ncbi:MAG: 16S rRNA (adenine(1518)-N(6)/adenine(1519)-N(6))-dimethyltransferase RsmA [Oscillospiraceae bacterium]